MNAPEALRRILGRIVALSLGPADTVTVTQEEFYTLANFHRMRSGNPTIFGHPMRIEDPIEQHR